MKCSKCNSTNTKIHDKNASKSTMRMKCSDCGHSWSIPKDGSEPIKAKSPNVGMTLEQFRSKHDVDFILNNALTTLSPDLIYMKADVYQICGLSASTPGLGSALDVKSEYYGKTGTEVFEL